MSTGFRNDVNYILPKLCAPFEKKLDPGFYPTAAANREQFMQQLFYEYVHDRNPSFYTATAQLVWMILPGFPLPVTPAAALDPFRIAERYGLFGVMTRARYEIEFQGSRDGQNWIAYPFRYKPQEPTKPPGIYAPYQPRLDWNLWFASLGPWREYPFVVRAEELLLENDRDVLSLFADNPFPGEPPRQVRAVVWQYWFTDLETKRAQGLWWRRQLLGLYAPELERESDGRFAIVAWPEASIPPP